MREFEILAGYFSLHAEKQIFFQSNATIQTKEKLEEFLTKEVKPLLFLLGDPGVGKTYLLEHIKAELTQKNIPFKFSQEILSSPVELFSFLLESPVDAQKEDLNALKNRVIQKYQEDKTIIIFDEAQLLNDVVLEHIRILSDTNHFIFLLAMHKKEAEMIFAKEHFKSRPHAMIYLQALNEDEILRYFQQQLHFNAVESHLYPIGKKELKKIRDYTQGNFRKVKQFYQTLFYVLDQAQLKNYTQYCKISRATVDMAAIDLEYLDVK